MIPNSSFGPIGSRVLGHTEADMADDESPLLATLEDGAWKAEICKTEMPGEFTLRFINGSGQTVEETALSGVSTYRQREGEIRERLRSYAKGDAPPPADFSSPGEY